MASFTVAVGVVAQKRLVSTSARLRSLCARSPVNFAEMHRRIEMTTVNSERFETYDELIGELRRLEAVSGKLAVINYLTINGLFLPEAVAFYNVFVKA
jgi:hypothetical protein